MNLSNSWGIITHEQLGRPRHRRDLNLAAVVRFANDYSVPGLAGLSFLRSIVWSLIGIEFAEAKRAEGKPVSASVIAEGIEALACWYSVNRENFEGFEHCVRGRRKLQRIRNVNGLRLKDLARGQGYVSQPIRMSIGACLPRLGFVDSASSRFNGYTLSERGKEFLGLALGNFNTAKALPKLWAWLNGAAWQDRHRAKEITLISPINPLSKRARKYFSALICSAGSPEDRDLRTCLWQSCLELLAQTPNPQMDTVASQLRDAVAQKDTEKAARLDWAQSFFVDALAMIFRRGGHDGHSTFRSEFELERRQQMRRESV